MQNPINSFMTSALNNFYYTGKMDKNTKVTYKKPTDNTSLKLKQSLLSEGSKFVKELSNGKTQISEKEFLAYFKTNLNNIYDEKAFKNLYFALNYDTRSHSLGVDAKEVASLILGMDYMDQKVNGAINQWEFGQILSLVVTDHRNDLQEFMNFIGRKIDKADF